MNMFYNGPNNQYIEAAYAPSGRSTCRACKQKIPQESIRLSYNIEADGHYSTYWYHLNCFQLKPKFIDIDPIEQIYNLDQIDGSPQDLDIVLAHIDSEKARLKSGGKKPKGGDKKKKQNNETEVKGQAIGEANKDKDKNESKQKKEEKVNQENEQKLAAYNEDQLKQYKRLIAEYSKLTAQKIKQMLSINNQPKTGNKTQLVAKCADGKILGQIPHCPKCGGGRPKFDQATATYKCSGYMDDDKYRFCKKTFAMSEIERPKWIDI